MTKVKLSEIIGSKDFISMMIQLCTHVLILNKLHRIDSKDSYIMSDELTFLHSIQNSLPPPYAPPPHSTFILAGCSHQSPIIGDFLPHLQEQTQASP